MDEPRKTPLWEAHRRLGARMVDFGGWSMPLQYTTGIIDEHRTTRSAVGVFDVCHMGEVHFRGARAAEAVQRLVTADVGALGPGRAVYTVACRPSGGIVDDLIVYRAAADHLLMVVNAANTAKDVAWFREHVGSWCEVTDASDETGLIAFQGPRAAEALGPLVPPASLGGRALGSLKSFDFAAEAAVSIDDGGGTVPVSIARTGYTGEDGFEIFCRAGDAPALWERLLAAAAGVGGKPAGLGARDTLRLEARLALYGNDLDDETTPLEAGLGRVVQPDAGDFVGREALVRQRAEGVQRKLAGFTMIGRGIPRHGYAILDAGGNRVGTVTSGGPGVTVDGNIGLGYVPAALAEPGTRLYVDCRGKVVEAEVVKGPF